MIRSDHPIFEEDNLELVNWIAIVGVVLIIAAYITVSSDADSKIHLSAKSLRYQMMNLIGAALVLVEAIPLQAWASMTINVVWLAIALWTIRKIRVRRKKNIL